MQTQIWFLGNHLRDGAFDDWRELEDSDGDVNVERGPSSLALPSGTSAGFPSL